MKFSPVHGTDPKEKHIRFFTTFNQDWSDLFRDQSWSGFTFINLAYENARYSGRFEVEVGLMGCNLTFTYIYNNSFNEKLMSVKDEIIASLRAEHGDNIKIEDPNGVLDKLDKDLK
jgi:hypothetical protein